MSSGLTIRRTPACSAERLLQVLSDPEFLIARHRAEGAVDATVQEISRVDSALVQQVAVREPAHTLHGLDPRRMESSTTTYRWDLRARRGTWRYSGPHDSLLTITGTFRVEPRGDSCSFVAEFTVTAKVPVIGRMIEQQITRTIAARQPQIDAGVDDFLTRR